MTHSPAQCIEMPTAPFHVNFVASRKFKLEITNRVLRLTEQLITQNLAPLTTLHFLAKWSFPKADCAKISVSHVENTQNILNDSYTLLGEFPIQVNVARGSQSDRTDSFNIAQAKQSILENLRNRLPSFDMKTLTSHRATCHLNESSGRKNQLLKMEFCTLVPQVNLQFRRISPLDLVASALSRSLSDPSISQYGSRTDFRFGYLSETHSNQFSVHLDSDPSILSLTLAGIWVSGIDQVDDPRVWAVSLGFLQTQRLPKAKRGSIVLLFCGNVTGQLTFYQVDYADAQSISVPTGSTDSPNMSKLEFTLYSTVIRPHDSDMCPDVLTYPLNPIHPMNPSCPTNEVSLPTSAEHPADGALDDASKLFTSTLSMLDASLLLEEGVAVSTSQILQHNVSSELTTDDIPRPLLTPPVSPKADSIPPVNETSPDKQRKQQLSTLYEHEEHQISYNPDRYNSPPPTTTSPRERKKPSQSGAASLQAVLSTLPPTQLRRLDQLINTLLEQNKNKQEDSESTLTSKAVDAGVNTTQMFSVPVQNSNEPDIASSVNLETTRAAPVSSDSVKSACRSRPTLADLRPLLRLSPRRNAKSTPSLNVISKMEERRDKYSQLLTKLQRAIERRLEVCSNPPRPYSIEQPPAAESVCDRPLDHLHSSLLCHRPSSVDRVSSWLLDDEPSNMASATLEDVIDSRLFRRDQQCQETLPSLSHIHCTTGNYENLLCDITDEQSKVIAHNSTDQSVFLAHLVDKYLGSKNQHSDEATTLKSSVDVTKYGGLNPSELSLATRDYLERHGLFGRAEALPVSSTPVRSSDCAPNLLDGLCLSNRSPLSANEEMSFTFSERSLPCGEERILDMERLRSLPKYL